MAAAKKSAASSTKKKRTPPTPKSLKNLPPGLQKYWRSKGVK